MPTEVAGYEAKRFVLRFEEDGGSTEANRLVLSAPLSEVVELLEKVLAFLRR